MASAACIALGTGIAHACAIGTLDPRIDASTKAAMNLLDIPANLGNRLTGVEFVISDFGHTWTCDAYRLSRFSSDACNSLNRNPYPLLRS